MSFIDSIKIRAKKDIKTIVLPEGNDIRTIEAVEKVRKEQFADVIVLGNKDEILNMAKEHNINIDGVKIINPVEDARFEKFANEFYELRKAKGMTLEKAKAKKGWYRYDTRFGIPKYDENGELEGYHIYSAKMLVRRDEDGKLYLYDFVRTKKETSSPLRQ